MLRKGRKEDFKLDMRKGKLLGEGGGTFSHAYKIKKSLEFWKKVTGSKSQETDREKKIARS